MKNAFLKKWKPILVWLSGYINFIAFALVGGYVLVKEEDEKLKNTAKLVLFITLIFTAASAFLAVINYVGGWFGGYYGSWVYDVYSICVSVVNIAKIGVYGFFIVREFLDKDTDPKSGEEQNADSDAQPEKSAED